MLQVMNKVGGTVISLVISSFLYLLIANSPEIFNLFIFTVLC